MNAGIVLINSHKPNDPRYYCKICNHAESKHRPDGVLRPYDCGYVPAYLDLIQDFCPCMEYVPADNLEYLEYKLKKKENEQLLG